MREGSGRWKSKVQLISLDYDLAGGAQAVAAAEDGLAAARFLKGIEPFCPVVVQKSIFDRLGIVVNLAGGGFGTGSGPHFGYENVAAAEIKSSCAHGERSCERKKMQAYNFGPGTELAAFCAWAARQLPLTHPTVFFGPVFTNKTQ